MLTYVHTWPGQLRATWICCAGNNMRMIRWVKEIYKKVKKKKMLRLKKNSFDWDSNLDRDVCNPCR